MEKEIFTPGSALRLPTQPGRPGRIIEAAVYALLAAFFAYASAADLCALAGSLRAFALSLVMLCALALALWAIWRLARFEKLLLVMILILAAAVRLWYVLTVPTQPASDFAMMYGSALQSAQGDFTWADVTEGYYSWWQYQIPFVLYEALILKLWPSMAALKLMNIIWGVGTVFLIFRIAADFLPNRCALASAFLYAVHPGQIMLTSVLTNQIVSLFFVLCGLYALLRARSLWGCALAGCLFALGNLMRPEAAIVIAACACALLCAFIQRPSKKRLLTLVLTLAAVVGAYYLFQTAAGLILRTAGAAPHGIGNSVPEWKLVVGLNPDSGGTVTDKDIYVLYLSDPAQRRAESRAVIKGYITGRTEILPFLYGKLKYFWISAEDTIFTSAGVNVAAQVLPGVSVEALLTKLSHFELAERFAAYVLSLCGCAMLARGAFSGRRGESPAPLIAAAVLCGVILVYLFIEIQPRYRCFAMPFIFLLASVPGAYMTRKKS